MFKGNDFLHVQDAMKLKYAKTLHNMTEKIPGTNKAKIYASNEADAFSILSELALKNLGLSDHWQIEYLGDEDALAHKIIDELYAEQQVFIVATSNPG